jgi:hypothetical protein
LRGEHNTKPLSAGSPDVQHRAARRDVMYESITKMPSPWRRARPAGPVFALSAEAIYTKRHAQEPSMSQPLIVSIPHRLGRQEAKRRLDSGIGRIRPELAGLVNSLDYRWDGDSLNFRAAALWQTITGRLEVLEDVVRIEIDLPWMMRLLGDTIMKQVRGRGLALLENPPDKS